MIQQYPDVVEITSRKSTTDDRNTDSAEGLYTYDDAETIHNFSIFQNNPLSLLKIATPALISIALCPLTIYIQPKMLEFFYPDFMGGRRNINDSVSIFLLPAGLVYAMAFAFALQDTHAKFDVTTASVDRHLTLLRFVMTSQVALS